jgi:hypothetical protein
MHDALEKVVRDLPGDASSSHAARARSAYGMLIHVDDMLDAFFRHGPSDHGTVLLDVFGFLQALFVGIDALYDLSIGLTSYKYHVNVNKNDTLRELKFIRNDIVGHPTHRTYFDGGTGFSTIVPGAISKETLTYETYIYRKNAFEIERRNIMFKTLQAQYTKEKEQIIRDLVRYMEKRHAATGLSDLLFRLFETLNLELLRRTRDEFMDVFGLEKDSKNRFLWRLSLLEKAIVWQESDPLRNEFVMYAAKMQASKLYDILSDLEDVKRETLFVSLPDLLSGFYRAMRRNEDKAYPLLKYVHERSHPYFRHDVRTLKTILRSSDSDALLDWLLELDDDEKVFLIGSMLRNYRPRR